MNKTNIPNFDSKKVTRAGTAATLRGVVAIYVGYMVYNILRGTLRGESTLPDWVAWLVSIVFIIADLVFVYYTYKCYRADLEAAKLPEDSSAPGEAEDPPEE